MDPSARTPTIDDLLAHVGWVQALARSLVRDTSTADDLAQETWMAALHGRRATNESPRGWLSRVLRNRLLQRARSERTRGDREETHADAAAIPSSEALLERMEQQRMLAGLLAALREPIRSTVILRYYEGLNSGEIAQRLGENPATIRQRLKRGLATLRENLDDRCVGGREAWLSALLPLAELGHTGATKVVPAGTSAGSALAGVLAMKKIVAAICALALAGSAILLLDNGDPVETHAGAVASTNSGAVTRPPVDAAIDAVPTEPARLPDSAPQAARVAQQGTASHQTVTGRVVWPAERPTFDETAEVFALGEELEYTRFVRILDDGVDEAIVARTTLADDGSFELALPADLDAVHLMVRGRHVYLETTVKIELGGSPSVVLAPICGAWIRGRVLAPPGASGSVMGARVRLFADEIFGSGELGRTRFTAAADENGRFELRAVVARPSATIFVSPGPFAAHLLDLGSIEPCVELDVSVPLAVGGGVRGRVVDEEGVGIANAILNAILRGQYFGFDDHAVGNAVSDAEGRFVLEPLPPGEVFVTASRSGYLESEKLELSILDGETIEGLAVELSAGHSVAGLATFADGTPAANALVTVAFDKSFQVGISAFNALRGADGEARTDAAGRFRVVGLGSGPFVVEATTESGETEFSAHADGVPPDTTDLALVLQPPLELRGLVMTAGGTPVTSFRVHAVRTSEGAVGPTATHRLAETFENEDGSFLLEGLIAGRWRVEVRSADFAPALPRTIELPSDATFEVVVTPPASVRGVVVDPSGTPIEGASVSLDTGQSQWEARFAGTIPGTSATTDGRGRFQLVGLRAGESLVRATHDDFAQSAPLPVSLAAGEEFGGVTLRLSQGGHVTGDVYDDGEPAAGRVISLVQWERGAFDTTMTETDEDGFFEFRNVEPGNWNVIAMDLAADWSDADDGSSMAQRMASMKSARVRVEERSEQHVVLGAPPARAIELRGRVTRAGRPYAGAMIAALAVGAGPGAESNMTGVGTNGEFALTVDGDGLYQLTVNRMGRAAGEISVISFLHDVPDEPEVVIDIEIPGGGIAGRVVDEHGRPLSGVGLSLMPGRDAELHQLFSRRFMQTTTDDKGRFEIPDLDHGSFRISASATGELAGAVLDAIDLGTDQWLRDVELTLPIAGTAIVRAVDPYDRPLSGLAVFARDSSGAVVHLISTTRTNDDGVARYDGLVPGEYTFFARNFEFTSSREVGASVRAGEEVMLDLSIEVGGHLLLSTKAVNGKVASTSFRVLDASGHEVANLFTGMFDAQEQSTSMLSGARTVGPLPAGRYRVTAITANGDRDERSVTLKKGGKRKLTLRPKPVR